jgi:hypothetical protein
MGRKSSAKGQARNDAPPPEPKRGPSALAIVIAVAIVAAGGAFFALRPAADTDTAQVAQREPEPVPAVNQHPHPQAVLPPLPFSPTPPARPTEVVREAYRFAAEHPEVLSYVPCYCGCEHAGHRGNEDCFVTARDSNGDVTEWEPHGMT